MPICTGFLLLNFSFLDISFILSLSEWFANMMFCAWESVGSSGKCWGCVSYNVGQNTKGLGSSGRITSLSKSWAISPENIAILFFYLSFSVFIYSKEGNLYTYIWVLQFEFNSYNFNYLYVSKVDNISLCKAKRVKIQMN